jgi:dipeptidyl-peptidase-4
MQRKPLVFRNRKPIDRGRDRKWINHERDQTRAHLHHAMLVLLLLSFPMLACAQGTRADYERAATMRQATRGLVLNEDLRLRWVGDHELVYRRQTAADAWEFVQVDARTGDKRQAFDHQAVAEAASALLGRTVAADELPIEYVVHDGDGLVMLFEGADEVLRVVDSNAPGGTLERIAIEHVPALHLPIARGRRSRNLGGETHIIFFNRSSAPVQTFWLDHDGAAHSYATIAPGARHRQHTFHGHLWSVRREDSEEIGRYRAAGNVSAVVIADPSTAHRGSSEQRTPLPRRPAPTRAGRSEAVSPDGRWEAFVRDHNIFLRNADRSTNVSEEIQLTNDGTRDNAYRERFRWSPDSRHLISIREEPSQEHPVYLIESSPKDQLQPRLHSFHYLKPGDRIAHPRPCLFDVVRHFQVDIDDRLFPLPWSIDQIHWRPDSSAFFFLYNQRGHQLMRVCAVDAATGRVRIVINEECRTFFDYANKLYCHYLDSRGQVLWMSERNGWNHLYLIDSGTGEVVRQLTKGTWVVRGVDRVDEETGEVWFRAVGVYPDQDPYQVHFGRIAFDDSEVTWLTEGDGTHEPPQYSPTAEYYVDAYSRVDLPPVHELRRTADGELLTVLERADWTPLLEAGWQPPARFSAPGRDGGTDIWGLIFLPSTFDGSQRYPVIENIYAGPHGHFVPKQFSSWHSSREIAELGFAVVHIDGMGTNWRSKAFHDVCWRNLGDSGFPDRIAWMKTAAQAHPYLNLSRVGIYGGSAGGQSALRALLAHGDFYHAAVADCGCHDNRMDKIWWNELWMGWPLGPHYEEQSNVTQAHNLQGKLLLIVGELDRNVDPASTMQVVDALIAADKDFDLLLMPSKGHGAAESPYGRRRRQDFFVRHLLGVEPRRESAEQIEAGESGTEHPQ